MDDVELELGGAELCGTNKTATIITIIANPARRAYDFL
jgi:hypothetical protein